MLTYNCSVCQGCYDNAPGWLLHLFHAEHQKLARMELLQRSNKMRSRSLVIFAGSPVGEDVRIIEKLSRDGGGGPLGSVVTDLVWWEGRPEVGFVQFESRENVTQVLASMRDRQFPEAFGEPVVWCVMDGDSISGVDWVTLLSECVDPRGEPSEGNGSLNGKDPDPDQKPVPKSEEEKINLNLLESFKPETSDTDPEDEEGFETAESASVISESGSLDDFQEELGLHQHLMTVRELIEIPDREYNTALDIAHYLQEALVNVRKDDGEPILKAVLNRHWLLKLKYGLAEGKVENAGCAIVVCIYRAASGFKLVDAIKSVQRIFDREDAIHHFPGYEVVEVQKDPNLGIGRQAGKHRNHRYRFEHRDPPDQPFWMSIVFKAGFPAESQVYNLVRHLCRFDPRCYPVLSLAFYWANINSVALGKSYMESCAKDLGDPCGLSWLLIFFFQMEGLIPSTREVLERPHEPMFNGKRDVGFAGHDTTWWRETEKESNSKGDGGDEMFAEEVFTLLYKFFLFCDAQLGGGSGENHGWILNTRDSEKLSIRDVLAGKVSDSKLTPKELQDIRKGLEQEGSKCDKLVMLNPFFIDWERKISCGNSMAAFGALKKMKMTGMKLKEYLRKDNIIIKREKLESEEFLNLLKL